MNPLTLPVLLNSRRSPLPIGEREGVRGMQGSKFSNLPGRVKDGRITSYPVIPRFSDSLVLLEQRIPKELDPV